jgi:hypothetical protein
MNTASDRTSLIAFVTTVIAANAAVALAVMQYGLVG